VLDPPKKVIPLRNFKEVLRELVRVFGENLRGFARDKKNFDELLEELYGPNTSNSQEA